MPATATPPPATPIIASPAPSPTPAPTQAPATEKPVVPTPKPGSAKAGFYSALDKKAQPASQEAIAPAEKPPEPKPQPKPVETKPPTPTPEKPVEKPGETDTTQKGQSPWKMVDHYKKLHAKAEAEIAEFKKTGISQELAQKVAEREQTLRKRLDELEGEIRFVNYSKSAEFQEKYKKPYEQAWQRAMTNLAEIPVDDGRGGTRPLQAEDVVQLVNLPLAQAKLLAVERFGDFADDVLAERKEIRKLWDAQSAALEEAHKAASDRDNLLNQQWQAHNATMRKEVSEQWSAANEATVKHDKYGKYFSPVEGDEEGNTILQKGYALVDDAFATNALDPRLNPQQRAAAIKKHVAIRHRAAAFGRLVRQVNSQESKIKQLEAELAEYKGTSPDVAGKETTATTPKAGSVRDEVMAAFDQRALRA